MQVQHCVVCVYFSVVYCFVFIQLVSYRSCFFQNIFFSVLFHAPAFFKANCLLVTARCAASSSSPASLPSKPAPLHRVAGRWVIGDSISIAVVITSRIMSLSRIASGDPLSIPNVMEATQGPVATAETPPAVRSALEDPLPHLSQGSRMAWGEEGVVPFDHGVSLLHVRC
jgi:hypothetical protein